jgi:hypothetical protein
MRIASIALLIRFGMLAARPATTLANGSGVVEIGIDSSAQPKYWDNPEFLAMCNSGLSRFVPRAVLVSAAYCCQSKASVRHIPRNRRSN